MEQKKEKFSWSNREGCITCVGETFETLDAGYYNFYQSPSIGLYFLKARVETNKLFPLPNESTNVILNDIQKFWSLEKTYKKYGRVYRRNYLIYSAPGTGKTSLIKLMCKDLIEKYNGIVLTISNMDHLQLYPDALRAIRDVEPERKIITIIEDLDAFTDEDNTYGNPVNSLLLNILDGSQTLSNVVTIATTNYIEKIAGRYKNRPSRFDLVMEFPLPNSESRRMFIEKTVLPEDIKKINLDEWVKKTEGFSIDHINELILLYFVFGHTEEESFARVKKMAENNDTLVNETSTKKKVIGFKKTQSVCEDNPIGEPLKPSKY